MGWASRTVRVWLLGGEEAGLRDDEFSIGGFGWLFGFYRWCVSKRRAQAGFGPFGPLSPARDACSVMEQDYSADGRKAS